MALSKNQISLYRSLQQKKFRQQHGLFVAEGKKLVDEFLQSRLQVKTVMLSGDMKNKRQDYEVGGTEIIEISRADMERISGLKTPPEVMAVVELPRHGLLMDEITQAERILVLDGIQDPGNMGTIIRTADWFGIAFLLISENTADPYNPKVVQASMGSLSRVRIHKANLIESLSPLKKTHTIIGSTLDGLDYREFQPGSKKLILVTGSESHGISAAVQSLVDHRLTIPAVNSKAESLNAAVATGIFLSRFNS